MIQRDFNTDKTRNNCVSVLRMVFDYARGEKYITENPAAELEYRDTEAAEPDPFTYEEMRAILGWMKNHDMEQVHHYFWFAFFSGLRTSELIQLQWAKVDLRAGLVRVDEALVRQEVKSTKTNKRRDVELMSESFAALTAQKKHTYLAGAHVFLNPRTNGPYYNQQAPWLRMCAALKGLGIRHRPAYNTRHTFATLNLMAGANPYWLKDQMGHASLEMLMKVYSKWIRNADHGRERARLEHFMSQQPGDFAPSLPPEFSGTPNFLNLAPKNGAPTGIRTRV